MIANHFGHHVELAELRRRFSISLKGATLQQLMRHAATINMVARPLRLEISELKNLQLPCILHWNLNHFVVLKSIHTKWNGNINVTLLDPGVGERNLSLDEVSKYFTGIALELKPNESFVRTEEAKRIAIRELTGKIVGIRRAIIQIFVLAITLEIFAIVSPLFNQFVVDEVIVSGDVELLKVLVMGFALLLITQTAIGLARSWFLMRWSIDIGFQWATRVFAHLMRLPVSFFEKRHLGDIVSRFGSIAAIQSTLTGLFVESVLDGLMALLAMVMMFIYSLKLSCLVLVAVGLYAILRWMFYRPLREASRERLILSSKENSNFLETIRAITPLKLFGREVDRISRWQNLKQDVINRDIKTQKLGIIFKVSNTAISGAQALAMFYLGAELVIDRSLSVGMLMAFTSYASTFSSRIFSLIDLFMSIKMLGLHTERLSDIVLEVPEPEVYTETDLSRIQPSITLRDVKFRYAEGEPWILNGVNLHIPAGQSIALIGPSGCGKTTLCKIVLGLLTPTEGEVCVDNIPIQQLGLRQYREMVGTVMQDDALLAGSIFDNISFFDPLYDSERVEESAHYASIHEEIVKMPMGYQSLVGDMGSSLSGGQKQRVLLARALYKKPSVLALDEATSHLDVRNEALVSNALAKLKLTRIIVAHREETIRTAERVVQMHQGTIAEVRSPSPSEVTVATKLAAA
jgi:ATP-binding cassette subfamily B protein RaxB